MFFDCHCSSLHTDLLIYSSYWWKEITFQANEDTCIKAVIYN